MAPRRQWEDFRAVVMKDTFAASDHRALKDEGALYREL